MIITMSPNIEGYKIVEYCGTVIAAELVSLPITSEAKRHQNLVRSKFKLEETLKTQAENFGANAILSLSFSFAVDGMATGPCLLGSGTAVKIEKL